MPVVMGCETGKEKGHESCLLSYAALDGIINPAWILLVRVLSRGDYLIGHSSDIPVYINPLLGLQSHFGNKALKSQVFCPQNGTAVLEGSTKGHRPIVSDQHTRKTWKTPVGLTKALCSRLVLRWRLT